MLPDLGAVSATTTVYEFESPGAWCSEINNLEWVVSLFFGSKTSCLGTIVPQTVPHFLAACSYLPTFPHIVTCPVHLTSGTGRFAEATGNMTAIGEVDLVKGTVFRYSGQVCLAAPDQD